MAKAVIPLIPLREPKPMDLYHLGCHWLQDQDGFNLSRQMRGIQVGMAICEAAFLISYHAFALPTSKEEGCAWIFLFTVTPDPICFLPVHSRKILQSYVNSKNQSRKLTSTKGKKKKKKCEHICMLLELPSCILNFRSVILLVWRCSSVTSSFCLTHFLCVLWLLRHHHSFKPRVRAGLLLMLSRLWWHLAVVLPAVAEKIKKKGRYQH